MFTIKQDIFAAAGLASPAVEGWQDGLQAQDADSALREIAAILDALADAKGLPIANRLAVARALDRAGAPFAAQLCTDYRALLRGQAAREARLWQTLLAYWRSVEQVQAGFVDELFECDRLVDSACMAAVECALAALNEQAKLARMRYCAVDERIWRELGRLFSLAESAPAGVSESVEQIWARLFLREMASPQSLLPCDIEIVDSLVTRYASQFVCQCHAPAAGAYYFDLLAGRPPSRRIPPGEPAVSSRYLSAGECCRAAESDAALLLQQAVLDAFPELGYYAPDAVWRMMCHVAQYWSPTPPARGQDRSEVLSRVMIAFDVEELCRNVAMGGSAGSARQPEKIASMTESWLVRDESGGGFGAELPSQAADWLSAGKLIGFKREGGTRWGVGVIRRLEVELGGTGRVGIQILSEQPQVAWLRPLHDRTGISALGERKQGLFLSVPQGGEVGALLMFRGTYAQEPQIEWAHQGISAVLSIVKQAMHTDEFDLLMVRQT